MFVWDGCSLFSVLAELLHDINSILHDMQILKLYVLWGLWRPKKTLLGLSRIPSTLSALHSSTVPASYRQTTFFSHFSIYRLMLDHPPLNDIWKGKVMLVYWERTFVSKTWQIGHAIHLYCWWDLTLDRMGKLEAVHYPCMKRREECNPRSNMWSWDSNHIWPTAFVDKRGKERVINISSLCIAPIACSQF